MKREDINIFLNRNYNIIFDYIINKLKLVYFIDTNYLGQPSLNIQFKCRNYNIFNADLLKNKNISKLELHDSNIVVCEIYYFDKLRNNARMYIPFNSHKSELISFLKNDIDKKQNEINHIINELYGKYVNKLFIYDNILTISIESVIKNLFNIDSIKSKFVKWNNENNIQR